MVHQLNPGSKKEEESAEWLEAKARKARDLAAKLRSMGATDEAEELEKMASGLDAKRKPHLAEKGQYVPGL